MEGEEPVGRQQPTGTAHEAQLERGLRAAGLCPNCRANHGRARAPVSRTPVGRSPDEGAWRSPKGLRKLTAAVGVAGQTSGLNRLPRDSVWRSSRVGVCAGLAASL